MSALFQPFPTMYWLSCPSLKAAVSQLENQGIISEWEQRLQVTSGLYVPLTSFGHFSPRSGVLEYLGVLEFSKLDGLFCEHEAG